MLKARFDAAALPYTLLAALGVVSAAIWIFRSGLPPFIAGLLVIGVTILFSQALAIRLRKEPAARQSGEKGPQSEERDQHGS